MLALKIANLVLLVAFPVSWFLPLATSGLLPWFGGKEMSVISGVQILWESDRALALLVAFFAMIAPILKTLGLAAVQFNMLKPRALPVVDALAKLAMADVFLIAIYIMISQGIGIGRVSPAWGLYVFTACVLASIAIAFATRQRLGRR
ncbi:MAG: paraquat-inducible protein A [Pseudomonadota bacterium]